MKSDQSPTDLATPKKNLIEDLWTRLFIDLEHGNVVTAQLVDIEQFILNWAGLKELSEGERTDRALAEIANVDYRTRYDTERTKLAEYRGALSSISDRSTESSLRYIDIFLRNLVLSHGAILLSSMAFLGAAGTNSEASELFTAVLNALPMFMTLSVVGFITALVCIAAEALSTAMLGAFYMSSVITIKSLIEVENTLAAHKGNKKKIHSFFGVTLWGSLIFGSVSFGLLIINAVHFGYKLLRI